MKQKSCVMLSLFVLAPSLVSAAEPTAPRKFTGLAEVHSGDTLSVAGTVLHLKGVEAPEKGQQCRVASGRVFDCGLVSKTALMDLTVATPVSCKLTGGTRDNFPLAQCFAADYDLSRGMVHTGWALAWPPGGTVYSAVEKNARTSGNGMWRGIFITPWDWRRGERLPEEKPSP